MKKPTRLWPLFVEQAARKAVYPRRLFDLDADHPCWRAWSKIVDASMRGAYGADCPDGAGDATIASLQAWADEGRVIYDISPDLLTALRYTEVIEAAPLPTSAFYIGTPGLTYEADDGSIGNRMDGLLFLRVAEPVGTVLHLWGCCPRGLGPVMTTSILEEDLRKFPLKEAIERHLYKGTYQARKSRVLVTDVWNIFFNLLSYLAAERPDVVSQSSYIDASDRALAKTMSSHDARRHLESARIKDVRYSRVGANYRMPTALKEAIARGETVSRFVVRGHWRNQACGAGRQQRKRIWVQPFWKGPETGFTPTAVRRVAAGKDAAHAANNKEKSE